MLFDLLEDFLHFWVNICMMARNSVDVQTEETLSFIEEEEEEELPNIGVIILSDN